MAIDSRHEHRSRPHGPGVDADAYASRYQTQRVAHHLRTEDARFEDAHHRPPRRTRYPLPGHHARGSQRCAAGGPPRLSRFLPCGCCPSPSTATLPRLPSTKAASISSGRAGGINGNHSAGISWQELAGIDFLEPNFFRYGHVHFATFDDPRGLTSTGNGNRMAASARNPHAILFAWHQSRAYRQLRDLLTGGSAVPPPPHQPPPPAWQPSGWPPQQPPSTRGYSKLVDARPEWLNR